MKSYKFFHKAIIIPIGDYLGTKGSCADIDSFKPSFDFFKTVNSKKVINFF